MELTYAETREWIEKMLGSDVLDKEELLKFHRQIEVCQTDGQKHDGCGILLAICHLSY